MHHSITNYISYSKILSAAPSIFKIILAVFFLFFYSSVNGQKTDKIYLLNGDILTGEIKKLSLAILKFDLDGPGIIDIKWEKVKTVRSNREFEVVLASGEVLVTRLDSVFFNER